MFGDRLMQSDLNSPLAAGDLITFNQLVIEHQDCLYGWVFSLVNDPALAEDITQATFLTAFEKMHTFRGGSFQAWLFTIARNRSIDELRRIRRRPEVRLDAPIYEDADEDFASFLPSEAALPEEIITQAEQAEQMLVWLQKLPEPFQQVLRLVDMEDMDYHDAARILGLRIGTLKSRVARARSRLRQVILRNRQ